MANVTSAVKAAASSAPPQLYRKIAWRLFPLLMVTYTFAYLDRINIGFAKIHMAADIGLSEAMYGLGAGIFFLGYVMFEVPSNLLMQRIGARKTFTRILILWGSVSASMMFVTEPIQFYILRFLLGVFEAGFAPGMILFVTLWFPRVRMGAVMAILMIPSPLGSMIGGPLSTGIIVWFDGFAGLAGWQWMFLVEGLPCLILGVIVWRTLPNGPHEARWLSDEERFLIAKDLAADRKDDQGEKASFRKVLVNPRIYGLAVAYFAIISGLYTISFWLPTIIKDNGVESILQIGLWAALPFAVSLIAMQWVARRSDRTGERRWHCLVPLSVGSAALSVAALIPTPFAISIAALVVATAGLYCAYTVFWATSSAFLSGPAAAGGIAYINSIGLLGGFFSPTLIGYTKELTGTTSFGLLTIVAVLAVGGVALFLTRIRDASTTLGMTEDMATNVKRRSA